MILAHRIIRRVSFGKFVSTLSQVQEQNSSLIKAQIVDDYIKQLQPHNIPHAQKIIQYGFNSFAQISQRKIIKAVAPEDTSEISQEISEQNGCLARAIVNYYQKKNMPKAQHSAQLSQITFLLDELRNTKGKGSQQVKEEIIRKLLNKSSNNAQLEYIVRILIKNMNIGMTDKVMLPLLQQNPASEINPMLAKSLRSFQEAVKFGEKKGLLAAQIKYDGQRTMIFYDKHTVKMISRNGKEQKDSFPDLYDRVRSQLENISGLQSVVLDAQIVAVDRQTLTPLPIQALISRKGKSRQGMKESLIEKIMVFDILKKNNKNLTSMVYEDRIKEIPAFQGNGLCTNIKPQILRLPEQNSQFQEYFQRVIFEGYEGLILKAVSSQYDTKGSRTNWAKLKKGCTIDNRVFNGVELDLVLMGADRGKGKREGVFGSYLLGCPHNGKIVAICKVGTGLSDSQLLDMQHQAQYFQVPQKPQTYDIPKKLKVDTWFKQGIVIEVFSQEITRSPTYTLGDVGQGGLSLRFPRFIRRRDDKGVAQATTGEQIISLFRA